MGSTNDSKKIIKAKYKEVKRNVEKNLEIEKEDYIQIDKEKVNKLKSDLEGYIRIYLQCLKEGFSTTREKKEIKIKIKNRLIKLDKICDVFVKSRKKALKSLSIKIDNIYLSDIDMNEFDRCMEESLEEIAIEYKQKNKIVSFLSIFEKRYYLKLKLLAETKIREINEKKNELEKKVRIYVQGMADKNLGATNKSTLEIGIFEILLDLEKYDIFAKQRLAVLKRLNCYNKKLKFYNIGPDKYVELIREILKDKVEKYKKTGEIYSFIADIEKKYFYEMQEVVLKFLNEENAQYILQMNFAKNEIKSLYKDIFKDDKEFLKTVIKKLNDKRHFNYDAIKYFFVKNILLYIELPSENEEVNNNVYDYISKEEIQKGTPKQEIEYLVKTRSKEDLEQLKKNISNIINKFYIVDYGSSSDKYVYKTIKNKNALEEYLKNMKGIDINKLKDIELQISRIEGCLVRVKNILKEKIVINILQTNEDGKEFSILEQGTLKKPSFIKAKEKFFSYIDIYENIKDKLSKPSQKFFMYIFKYIVLDFRRRGHKDIELYDYVKDDTDFIEFYNKNIPDTENPNYIDKATDKKYALLPDEKIVHKAIAFITDYLNIKYDTGRKRRNKIIKEVYTTIKSENTGLRYFRRFLEEDFLQ